MFEYEDEIYTLEDLQVGAEEQGLDFETYLETMKALGMVEKADVVESESVDSPLDLPEIKPSTQDRIVQPNIVVPEIDADAPLNSGDFYFKSTGDKEEEVIPVAKQEDLYSATQMGDEVTHKIPKLDLDAARYADTPVAKDEDLLK